MAMPQYAGVIPVNSPYSRSHRPRYHTSYSPPLQEGRSSTTGRGREYSAGERKAQGTKVVVAESTVIPDTEYGTALG